jgi:hypothetical protein
VDCLGLGQKNSVNWSLRNLFIDTTDEEAGSGIRTTGVTRKQKRGFIDRIGPLCTLTRGQQSHQTRIWPGTAKSVDTLDNLVLSGLSYTPRSLILQFGRLDLQV